MATFVLLLVELLDLSYWYCLPAIEKGAEGLRTLFSSIVLFYQFGMGGRTAFADLFSEWLQ